MDVDGHEGARLAQLDGKHNGDEGQGPPFPIQDVSAPPVVQRK